MRAGTYLKPLMVQCALTAATRCREEDYFAGKYRRIRARRGHKRAIIAVARMMLTCIYHMLSNGELFDPSDRDSWGSGDRRARHVPDDRERRAIELLRSRGYNVSSPGAPA